MVWVLNENYYGNSYIQICKLIAYSFVNILKPLYIDGCMILVLKKKYKCKKLHGDLKINSFQFC